MRFDSSRQSWLYGAARILGWYGVVMTATLAARKLPNVLSLIVTAFTKIQLPFNYNHGIAVVLVSWLCYRFGAGRKTISILGNRPVAGLLFPLVLFTVYGATGISNTHQVNPHLWAIIVCGFALGYNLTEEYAWRGYLGDALNGARFMVKSLCSALLWALWHLLLFRNFDQYGGFGAFLLFCIVFSFILTFAVQRTRSVLAAAAIHGFLIQMNIAACICIAAFSLLLIGWNRLPGANANAATSDGDGKALPGISS